MTCRRPAPPSSTISKRASEHTMSCRSLLGEQKPEPDSLPTLKSKSSSVTAPRFCANNLLSRSGWSSPGSSGSMSCQVCVNMVLPRRTSEGALDEPVHGVATRPMFSADVACAILQASQEPLKTIWATKFQAPDAGFPEQQSLPSQLHQSLPSLCTLRHLPSCMSPKPTRFLG